MVIRKTVQFGQNHLVFETGRIARQASGSVLVDLNGTSVLVVAVGIHDDQVRDFLPLKVDYQERGYASGRIPGGFLKREGRPSDRETLIARLIDRPIRPLFPDKFRCEVQITATTMSINPDVNPDIVAMIGASAALSLSGIPQKSIMAAARVGYQDGMYVLNPSYEELKNSKLDLIVAGTKSSVLIVEAESEELLEDVMLGAVMFGQHHIQSIIEAIEEFAKEAGKPIWNWQPPTENMELYNLIKKAYYDNYLEAFQVADKLARQKLIKEINTAVLNEFMNENGNNSQQKPQKDVEEVIEKLHKNIVRNRILDQQLRIDGRTATCIRPITVETGILPRTHGSALFTRGETQALVTVTLGTSKDSQILDGPFCEKKENFMLHYNFPPYCVNEIGMVGSPKRREIGHGRLAKKGIQALLPDKKDFPYVTRVVSEITESNGSSSMASVCGSSLALMDAGVPIKASVVGIAMGLIKEKDRYTVLSDILGDEDHLGDMDFKVVGTEKGITALQMDIKISDITAEIMNVALDQARKGRLHILKIMNTAIDTPRVNMSNFAPRIILMKINPEKIRDVIGKGGVIIRELTEGTGVSIDIDDDGTIRLAAIDQNSLDSVKEKIKALTAEVESGQIYEGKIIKIVDFGAFVNLIPGKDGLLHISEISHRRIRNVHEELNEGDIIKVKVLEVDRQGKVRLSAKVLVDREVTC